MLEEVRAQRCPRSPSKAAERGVRLQEEENGGRADQLRKVDQQVLVPWMKTMLRQIRARNIVQ